MAREMRRININMPAETLERVDAYAEKMSINRTAAILVLCSMALDSQKAMSDLGELVKLVKSSEAASGSAQKLING